MSRISYFLAQVDIKDTLVPGLQKAGGNRGGLAFIFGACGVLTLLILIWAIFIRKRQDGSRRYSYASKSSKNSDGDASGQSSSQPEGRKRRRRKRRSRNPTLAETGGLPPIRTEGYFDDPA